MVQWGALPGLVRLRLQHTRLGADGVRALAAALEDGQQLPRYCPRLKTIAVSGEGEGLHMDALRAATSQRGVVLEEEDE